MPARRTNYSKLHDQKRPSGTTEMPEVQIGKPPKRYVYRKTSDSRIRIRKGPGTTFEHNGKYIDEQKRVEIVEIQGEWGLLKRYAETRDGWVCLKYLEFSE